jgi:hypothetical protein
MRPLTKPLNCQKVIVADRDVAARLPASVVTDDVHAAPPVLAQQHAWGATTSVQTSA